MIGLSCSTFTNASESISSSTSTTEITGIVPERPQVSQEISTDTPGLSLTLSDFLSVAHWVAYAIVHKQPAMMADVIGEGGAGFSGFAMGASEDRITTAETVVSELQKGLLNSSPQCLGYNDQDMSYDKDKAIIIFQGLNIDWEGLGMMGEPENDTVGFQFLLQEEKWLLTWITPMPNFFWSDYHWELTACP